MTVKSRRIWIWNLERSRQLPICGIMSTNGDGGLVQATLEAVDGSRFGVFFVQVEGLCAQGRVVVLELNRKCRVLELITLNHI